MRADAETYFASPRGIFDLLLGFLLPPAAFAVDQVVAYVFVDWACKSAGPLPIHLMNLFALIVGVVGVLLSYRNWAAAGREWPEEMGGVLGRTRFMAIVSTFFGAYFVVAIIALGIPPLLVGVCRG